MLNLYIFNETIEEKYISELYIFYLTQVSHAKCMLESKFRRVDKNSIQRFLTQEEEKPSILPLILFFFFLYPFNDAILIFKIQ